MPPLPHEIREACEWQVHRTLPPVISGLSVASRIKRMSLAEIRDARAAHAKAMQNRKAR